jgi:hypothetical protein
MAVIQPHLLRRVPFLAALEQTLSVLDYMSGISPGYAFRFAGDLASNAAFLSLINGTTIDGHRPIQFRRVFTNVTASPELSTMALIGLAMMGLAAIRTIR